MNRAMNKENSFHLSVFTFPSAAHVDEASLFSVILHQILSRRQIHGVAMYVESAPNR
jgi:hypothetical protein